MDKVYYHEVRKLIEKYMKQEGVEAAVNEIETMIHALKLELPLETKEDEKQTGSTT